jgi:hypothetical protein
MIHDFRTIPKVLMALIPLDRAIPHHQQTIDDIPEQICMHMASRQVVLLRFCSDVLIVMVVRSLFGSCFVKD